MKKNTRIISAAAAALLAVAPVATGVVPGVNGVVNAADFTGSVTGNNGSSTGNNAASQGTTTPIQNAPSDRPFFAIGNQAIGQADASNPYANVIRTTITIEVGDTADQIATALKNLKLDFYGSTSDKTGTSFAPTAKQVENLLSNVTFETKDGKRVVKAVPNGDFNLTITNTADNKSASVQIPFVVSNSSTNTNNADVPVISYTIGGQKGVNSVFQVAANSQFNPLNFTDASGSQVVFSAVQAQGSPVQASLVATSNPVNTAEQGRFYNVTLTATNLNGKTSTFTYTVLITSSQKQTLYGNGTISTYNIYGNNVLNGSTTFKTGDQVYVADSTRTINGISYSQVSPESKAKASTSNVWVKTSDLTKPAVTEQSQAQTVMVTSNAYDKNGKYLGHKYYAYNTINIVPTVVTINGKTYYKIAGKDEYVRVINITGQTRTLKRNAYVYATSTRRNRNYKLMHKGDQVTTYGGAMKFRNGKKYYRIEGCRNNDKKYIKAVNFR